MERTQAFIVHSGLTQVNKLADYIYDVHGFHNLIYRRSVYHTGYKDTKNFELCISETKINTNLFCISLDLH